MNDARLNLWYALRSIRRNPGFAAVAVLSLALGIGANTAIFRLLDHLVLASVPVREPERLQHVVLMTARGPYYRISFPKFVMLRDNFDIFESLFGWSSREFDLTIGDRSQPIRTDLVTGTYFTSLGTQPIRGRLIEPQDDRPGAAPVVVLSYRLAETLGASGSAVGRTIKLGDQTYEIVGIAPRGFAGLEQQLRADAFLPFHAAERFAPQIIRNEGAMAFFAMGRLKRDVTLASAQVALREGWPRFSIPRQKLLGDRSRPEYLILQDGSRGFSLARVEFATAVTVLMCLVGVVFLIACANLATLLLVRGMARAGETGIRIALGAGRGQLIRQWMSECLLLSVLGGVGGVLLAQWITKGLLLFLPAHDRIWLEFQSDYRVFAVSVALTCVAGLLFGLIPALRATQVDVHLAIKENAKSVARGRSRLAQGFLAVQLAAALVLSTGAVLFSRTLQQLNAMSGGFDRNAVAYGFVAGGVPRDRLARVANDAVESLTTSPQIASVSRGGLPFVWGSGGWGWVDVPGYTPADGEDNVVYSGMAAPGYFQTMGIPFVGGRDFESRDFAPKAPKVVIVSDSFVRRYFSGRDPLGQTFRYGQGEALQIVGVVKDIKGSAMRESQRDVAYYPMGPNNGGAIVARAKPGLPVSTAEAEIRGALSAAASGARIQTGTFERAVQDSLGRDRLLAQLSAAFGILGVLLAGIGLYGATAHAVATRTREMGLRIALGATGGDIFRLVFREIFLVIGAGLLLGLPLVIVSGRFIASLLFGVSPWDPLPMAAAGFVLLLAGLAAGGRPAWRAMRLDPARNLRHE